MGHQGLPGAPVEHGDPPPLNAEAPTLQTPCPTFDMAADDRSSLNDQDVIGLRHVRRTASESGTSYDEHDGYDL